MYLKESINTAMCIVYVFALKMYLDISDCCHHVFDSGSTFALRTYVGVLNLHCNRATLMLILC